MRSVARNGPRIRSVSMNSLVGDPGELTNRFNPQLKSAGVVVNMLAADEPDSVRIYDSCRSHLSRSLFSTAVKADRQVAAAALQGVPVIVSDCESEAARSYLRMSEELIARVQ